MPTYRVTTAEGLLLGRVKSDLAQAITLAHTDITGAPRSFAQVMFAELSLSDIYVGGRPLQHGHIFIFGHIRDGRAATDRKRLILRLAQDTARITGLPATSIWVYIHELPSAAMVEFGQILPQAGDEPVWTDALPETIRNFLSALEEGN